MDDELDGLSLAQRLVLLSVTDLSGRQEEPAAAHEIQRVSRDHAAALDIGGKLSEPDVIRALYALESAGFVAETGKADVSAVGKGRPSYRLAVDTESLLAALGDDDRLAPAVESLGGD